MARPRSAKEADLFIQRVLHFAEQQRVLIGIPAQNSHREPEAGEKSAPSNAQIAYWAEYGAPEANIPERPFLGPGMEASEDMIVTELSRAMTKAITLAMIDGDVTGGKAAITEGLNRVGLKATANVQRQITDGTFAPLAARTIKARLRRGRTGDKPLIDTGQLRRSVTYVIRYR